MRIFRKMLHERGWKAEKLTPDWSNDLILTRPDGKEIRVSSSTPPTTSVFALHLADNKLESYSLLEQLGVPQPETLVVKSPEDAQQLLDKYGTIVIKPVDGAHGRGSAISGLCSLGILIRWFPLISPAWFLRFSLPFSFWERRLVWQKPLGLSLLARAHFWWLRRKKRTPQSRQRGTCGFSMGPAPLSLQAWLRFWARWESQG